MSDDFNADLAAELAKQLPVKAVYDDGVSPAMKEAGSLLADCIKTVRLALAPVQFAASIQDRLSSFLKQAVDRVPEELRIAPAPQILGPVIEGIKYESEQSELEELFSNLLSKAMNKELVHLAHPAFIILIKQIAPDEILILKTLQDKIYEKIVERIHSPDRNDFLENKKLIEHNLLDELSLAYPSNFDMYYNHLASLGLVVNNASRSEQSKNFTIDRKVNMIKSYYLSELGDDFLKACMPDH